MARLADHNDRATSPNRLAIPVRSNQTDAKWILELKQGLEDIGVQHTDVTRQLSSERERRRAAEREADRFRDERDHAVAQFNTLSHINSPNNPIPGGVHIEEENEMQDDEDNGVAYEKPADDGISASQVSVGFELLKRENRRLRSAWRNCEQHRARHRAWMDSALETLRSTGTTLQNSSETCKPKYPRVELPSWVDS